MGGWDGKKGERVERETGVPIILVYVKGYKARKCPDQIYSFWKHSLWNFGEHEGKEQGVPSEGCCRNPEEKRWWTETGPTGEGEALV